MSNNNLCLLVAKVDDTQAPSIDDTIHLFYNNNNNKMQIILLSTHSKNLKLIGSNLQKNNRGTIASVP